MAATSFFGGAFFGGEFFNSGGPTPTPDTAFMLHGGGASRSKKDRTLREQIVALFEDASEIPALAVAVQKIVEPHVTTETAKRVRVDWRELRKDMDTVNRLLDLAERAAQMEFADREDEEDIELLLLH